MRIDYVLFHKKSYMASRRQEVSILSIADSKEKGLKLEGPLVLPFL